jgi:7-cyano-7-deazaguanine synthase
VTTPPPGVLVRDLTLNEAIDRYGRLMQLLGTSEPTGPRAFGRPYESAPTETPRAGDIFIGVNALDYSGYPDCRPEYIAAYERMANLATRASVEGTNPIRIRAPFIDRSKAQIIQLGLSLGVDYALTRSCYDPDPSGAACGHCDSCLLRLKGFAEAGAKDPARYV